jgi:biotin operon repressor
VVPALAEGATPLRKDVREFVRRLEAVGLTVESTPGHYHVLRDGKPLRKQNGMPFTLPFSPDTIRWRRSAVIELPQARHRAVTPGETCRRRWPF